MRISSASSIVYGASLLSAVHGWVTPVSHSHKTSRSLRAAPLGADALGGVAEFDQWFADLDKATCQTCIQHHAFGSLRGLRCQDSNVGGNVLTVPKNVVLSSSYGDEDWDSQLAQKLWAECKRGQSSEFYGYCSLLARGEPIEVNSVPLSTAPNTVRHWTKDQLDGLALSPKGKKLLALNKAQQKQWKQTYESSLSAKNTMSWEQFEWCMEVVHSRAFRGNYGLSPVRSIASAAAPLISAIVGWTYIQGNPDIADSVLLGLAAFAVSPLLIGQVFPDKGEVVLLPLIDSANHREEADSSIQYDPLGGAFSLTVGSKCLVPEGSDTQLYISYGPKSDAELMLNYGFLPGVSCAEDNDDVQRSQLTDEFTKRSL